MAIVHEPAICLRRFDYSESSLVLHMLTRESGLLHLLAKGAKRPKSAFDGGLDLGDQGVASYSLGKLGSGNDKGSFAESGPPMGLMTAWYQENGHRDLRRTLLTLLACDHALELARLFVHEHQPAPEVYDLLARVLGELDVAGRCMESAAPAAVDGAIDRDNRTIQGREALEAEPSPMLMAMLSYVRDLLDATGFAPLVDVCVDTQLPVTRGEPLWFSALSGGVVTRAAQGGHADRIAIDPPTHQALCGQRAPALPCIAALCLLEEHVEVVLGRRLRTWPAIRQRL